jgi:hypothetical protein
MPLSLFEISIPVFIRNLKILSHLLEKGRVHVSGNETSLIAAKLIDDMGQLSFQVQRISDTAKGVAVRVGRKEPIPMEDNEKTFPELQDRITRTIAILEKLDPKGIDEMEDKEVVLKTRYGEMNLTGTSYILSYAIPNFYFHLCMAYAILRKEGVPVGKSDYLFGASS